MYSVIAAMFLAAASPQGTDTCAQASAAASLEGDWRLRMLDLDTGRPSRHSSFKIEEAADGRLKGAFPDALYGDFRDGAFADDGDGLSLTFKTARGAVGWLLSGEVSGGELSYEARLKGGRLDGVAKDKTGAVVLRWQARKLDDDGDRGEFLAGRTWRLRIVDQPDDFCRETYEFRDDGTMTSRSGEEVLEESWRVETQGYDSTLVTRVLSTNGKPDCQGDTNAAVGAERALPIVFFNGGGYAVCAGPDRGLSCYGAVSEVVAPKAPSQTPARKTYPPDVLPRLMKPDEERDWYARKCDDGNGAACLRLSDLFTNLRTGPVDKTAAVEAARKGCDLGHDDSCFAYASDFFVGAAGPKDTPAALKIFDAACLRDHALSCLMSGRVRLSADAPAYAEALAFSHRGCDLGAGVACGDEALALINLFPDRERPGRLRAMLKAGCEADGKAGHCGPFGGYLLAGRGGPVDIEAARAAYQRGCNAGDGLSCFGYAEFIASGHEKGMKRKSARSYYEFACDKGVEPACKRAGKRTEKK